MSDSKYPLALTWAAFLDQIRQARADLGGGATWYRGQAKREQKLIPSLLRHGNGLKKERDLFNEYERSAALIQGERKGEWEMLNDMQHYGIPTRLLDWTDVLGIAIAFALYDSQNDGEDSAIFVLNPVALNEMSGVEGIRRAENDPNFSYKSVYWERRPFSPSFPIAIDGTLHNGRLRAQNGTFTVHGLSADPLDIQAPRVVKKIILTSQIKTDARDFLEYANLNPFSIYPDIVGMAQHIRRKHLDL